MLYIHGAYLSFFLWFSSWLEPESLKWVAIFESFYRIHEADSLQIKKDVKEKLTIQSTGNSAGGPRTHIQGLPSSMHRLHLANSMESSSKLWCCFDPHSTLRLPIFPT